MIPVISDFGWSTHTHGGRKKTQCGTLYYMAPELFRGMDYSFDIDTWAIGVLAFEITSGKLPFDGTKNKQIKLKVLNAQFERRNFTSDHAWDFIKRILIEKADMRMDIDEILDHPWIREYFPQIKDKRIEEQKRRERPPALRKPWDKKVKFANPDRPFNRYQNRPITPPPN